MIKIGIIFGGRSGEHEVSLMSGQSVMAALDRGKYEVVPIGIDKDGRWLIGDVAATLTAGGGDSHRAALLPDPHAAGLMRVDGDNLTAVAHLDVVFPVLHGTYGEDGTVQGLLELAGIPYVGAGVVGSAVGMDKAIFKAVMTAVGIPILPWKLVLSADWRRRGDGVLDEIEAALEYPLFVKPANLGSSVGISKCRNRAELWAGLDDAAQYDRRMVVEKGINGRELEISVLGNADPVASVVGEVIPRRDFYDYKAKYLAEPGSEDESELAIPAALSPAVANAARTMAIKAYQAIDCAGLGRVDLLMDRADGRLYLNEINTIPGFTQISMYPKLWEASGLSYPQLLDRLVELALERYGEKVNLKTEVTSSE